MNEKTRKPGDEAIPGQAAGLRGAELEELGRFRAAAHAYMAEGCAGRARRAFERAQAAIEGAQVLEGAGFLMLAAELYVVARRGQRAAELYNQLNMRAEAASALVGCDRLRPAVDLYVALGQPVEAAEILVKMRRGGALAGNAGTWPADDVVEQIAEGCLAKRRADLAAPLLRQIGRKEHAALAYRAAGDWLNAGTLFLELGRPADALGAYMRGQLDDCIRRLMQGKLSDADRTECLERLRKMGRADLAAELADAAAARQRRLGTTPTARPTLTPVDPRRYAAPGYQSTATWQETETGPGGSEDKNAREPVAVEPPRRVTASLQQMDRFELVGVIGKGSFGRVYRARDRILDRNVAIKVLPAGEQGIAGMREARIAAGLAHPNIVTVYDVFQDDTANVHLVMELVEGGSCEPVFQNRLTVPALMGFARQVAAGLAHAHGAGVVHRDLKPANVLLTPAAIAKITDFGLARGMDEAHSPRISGTPRYMPPEQRLGAPPRPCNDVYAFGAMFLEAATGCRADLVTLRGHAPEVLLGAFPELGRLAGLLAECLRLDAGARPSSGAELVQRLEAMAQPSGILESPAAVRLAA